MQQQLTGRWLRFKPWKSASDVDKLVRQLVDHCAMKVPFYRAAWAEAGVQVSRIRCAADLPNLPITEREDLMLAGPGRYLRSGVAQRKLVVQHTTGTSGTPVAVYMSPVEARFRALTVFRSFRSNAKLSLVGTVADVGPQRKDRTKTIQRFGTITVVRLFADMPMEEQMVLLKRHRPMLIEGRPSSLWKLCRAIQETDTHLEPPRLVVSFGEMLFPHVRRILQDVFSCAVADYYNAEEIGNVAWQCPHHPSRMHVNLGCVWVEIVGRDGSTLPWGETGDVVVTNLYNRTMPFVRYAIGDRAVMFEPGRCSCGYEGPTLGTIDGRDEDFFLLPDGREVSPREVFAIVNRTLLTGRVDDVLNRAIIRFQVVQESVDSLVVHVIPGPDYNEGIWSRFQDNVRTLHPSMRTRVECVDSIEPGTPGTKARSIRSLIETRWGKLRRMDGRGATLQGDGS